MLKLIEKTIILLCKIEFTDVLHNVNNSKTNKINTLQRFIIMDFNTISE